MRAARDREDEVTGRKAEPGGNAGSGMGQGFRLATEMVSALVVGTLIGVWLDRWFKTSPLFLLVFFFLGAAAAMLGAYRMSKETSAAAKNEDAKRRD